jgi:hypothetical protein
MSPRFPVAAFDESATADGSGDGAWGRLMPPLCKCCGQPGTKSSSAFPASAPATRHANRSAGARRFNRSSMIMSSASMVAVEKSGPDFHRLAAPTCPKSPIQSIPKYGSAIVGLRYGDDETSRGPELCVLYLDCAHAPSPGSFRAGSVANPFRHRKACGAPHEVIRAVSGLASPRSGTLPRSRPPVVLVGASPQKTGRSHPSSEPSNPRSATAAACMASCAA